MNLVDNAIEAMAGVRDGAKSLVLSSRLHGGELVIQVRGRGVGINNPTLLLEPFFTTNQAGHGLLFSVDRRGAACMVVESGEPRMMTPSDIHFYSSAGFGLLGVKPRRFGADDNRTRCGNQRRNPLRRTGCTGLRGQLEGFEGGNGLHAAAWEQSEVVAACFVRRWVGIIRPEMAAAAFAARKSRDCEKARDEHDVPRLAAECFTGHHVESRHSAAQSCLAAHEAHLAPHQRSHVVDQPIGEGRFGILATAAGR